MLTESIVEDDRWKDVNLPGLAEKASTAALRALSLDPECFEVSVLGCDDARISELNASFRGKPTPTNVLSWPAHDLTPPELPQPDATGDNSLGDIAIAFDTCTRESVEQGKEMSDHVTHLLVHATLHLLGHDHQNDTEAEVMERLEVEILGKLGLPDPYY